MIWLIGHSQFELDAFCRARGLFRRDVRHVTTGEDLHRSTIRPYDRVVWSSEGLSASRFEELAHAVSQARMRVVSGRMS